MNWLTAGLVMRSTIYSGWYLRWMLRAAPRRLAMARISEAARDLYRAEMAAAAVTGVAEQRWRHLERAHIVSQPDPWLHTQNHIAMFRFAVRQHDRREALGQVVRIIVAAPGSLSGRYPEGNTGRVSVGLMRPMPIPGDIASALRSPSPTQTQQG
nr:hypothetical protein [Gordonia westfalica]